MRPVTETFWDTGQFLLVMSLDGKSETNFMSLLLSLQKKE